MINAKNIRIVKSSESPDKLRVALVYDRVNKIGGAERVLTAIHDIWPTAPLYTAVYNPSTAPWAKSFRVITSFLQNIPGAKTHHELLPLLTPFAFESLDLSEYDVIISITSAEAKAIITSPRQLHICYLLTPTRYLWSHAQEYAGEGIIGSLRKKLIQSQQQWDLIASTRPDKYVAISQAVAHRCRTYYHRDSDAIIYPPVETAQFSSHPEKCLNPGNNYLLLVSRLVPYKRVDLAIQACNRLQLPLYIVGSGSEMNKLRKIAGPTIRFYGNISDEALACIYHHALALLFPQEEEFGITAIEAQAAGIPVIAFNRGAAPETIIQEKTGILFPEQTVSSLEKAITTLKNHTWYDKTIQEHAKEFDRCVFQQQFKSFVEDSWKNINV